LFGARDGVTGRQIPGKPVAGAILAEIGNVAVRIDFATALGLTRSGSKPEINPKETLFLDRIKPRIESICESPACLRCQAHRKGRSNDPG
jgi:hypothetical protein